MNSANFYRPYDIDEPPMIIFWEIPEFIIGTSLLALGIILGTLLSIAIFFYLGIKYLLVAKRNAQTSKRGEYVHKVWLIGLRNDKHLSIYPINIRDVSGK